VGTQADGSVPGGLEASSIRVWDNGVPQTFTSFEKIPSAGGERAAAPPPFFSNRREPQKHNQVLTIVLFDAVNTDWVDQMRARQAVMKVVAQRPPEEHVAVLVLGNTLRVLHDFSSDRDSLLRKLKSFWGDLPYGQDFDPSETAADLNSAGLPPRLAALAGSNKILDSLSALEAVANYVKDAPGRKDLIWVTGGFPLSIQSQSSEQRLGDVRNFGPEFAHAVQALNSADVSVYPIDARGLTPSPRAFVNIATMREFASRTGGVAYYNRNDLDRGIRKALDEEREVYFLSYTPRPFTEDGSFHKIRVETAQRGVQLRYRQGYFAPGLRSTEKVKPADRLRAAVSSPVSVSEIGLDARLEPDAGVSTDLKLALRIDGADLDLLSENGKWSGGVNLVVMQTGPAGELLGGISQIVQLTLSQDSLQRMLGGGWIHRISVPRQANAAWLRIGLLDERSGRVGSIKIPLSP
jgi:VWFA-related protein